MKPFYICIICADIVEFYFYKSILPQMKAKINSIGEIFDNYLSFATRLEVMAIAIDKNYKLSFA